MRANTLFVRKGIWAFVASLLLVVSGGACGGGGGNGSGSIDGSGGNTGIGASAGGGRSSGGTECLIADTASPGEAADHVTFDPNVTVTTLAGSSTYGSMDGPPTIATFKNPVNVVVDTAGSVLVSDYDSFAIRRVAVDGTVTTLTKQQGFAQPFGLGWGKDGALYVGTDYDPQGNKNSQSGTIWKVDATSGVATPAALDMGRARSFAALADGRMVVANYQNNRLYTMDAGFALTELAGGTVPGCPGGFADGVGAAARFWAPYGMATLRDGRVIVADYGNHRLRAVTADGSVTTFAGDGGIGSIDGPSAQARFSGPESVAVDSHDNVYVSDSLAHRIRRISADGNVTTVAGTGAAGWNDGAGAQAQFYGQEGLAVTADGATLFVADGSSGTTAPYNRIRKIQFGP
jgi:sugar lactone lactonase YvrE